MTTQRSEIHLEQGSQSSSLQLLKIILIAPLSLFLLNCSPQLKKSEDFSFNLPREIHSLDPLLLRGTAKKYALFNLNRGLYYYNKDNKLTPHGVKSCEWSKNTSLLCTLASKKWSDGSPIQAKHYVYSYNQIKLHKEESSVFLDNIKRVSAVSENSLKIELYKQDSEFIHRLASFNFFPRNQNKLFKTTKGQLFSGPYKLKKLDSSRISLENNTFYDEKLRPHATGVFVDDSSTALNMYNADQLDFLRYLESANINHYPNVFRTDFAKLDGLFINSFKIQDESFRKALFHALDFKALQKIFKSPSAPGCLGVPISFFKEPIPCFKMDLKKARLLLGSYKGKLKKQNHKIFIPSMQSFDHQKMALWAKEQWKKNLGLDFEIIQLETGVFHQEIRKQKLPFYRKALALEGLSCKSAMKTLAVQPEFARLNLKLNQDCRSFFRSILSTYQWLPLGMPAFAHLHSKKFSGYYINILGHFGLENLERK